MTELIFVKLNQNTMPDSLRVDRSPLILMPLATMILLLVIALSAFMGMSLQGMTIYSLPFESMLWTFPFLQMFLWLCYALTRRYMCSMKMAWIHIVLTVFTTLLIGIVIFIGAAPAQFLRVNDLMVGKALQILTLLFALGQMIYVANLCIGLTGRYGVVKKDSTV
jgi:hypothetical protein